MRAAGDATLVASGSASSALDLLPRAPLLVERVDSEAAQIPSPIAATAAAAAIAAIAAKAQRAPERNDVRPLGARPRSRIRSRSAAAARGDSTANASAVAAALERGELLAAALARARGAARTPAPPRVERVERVGGGQLVDGPDSISVSSVSSQQLAQAREPGEHPTLDRTERLPEPLGELGLREAAVVRELERLALRVGELPQRVLDALALQRSQASSSAASATRLGASSSASVRRRCSRRTMSTARRWTSVRIQVLAFARSGTKRAARAPDGEERLLHRVLGERAVAQDPQREPVRDAPEAVVELGESRLVRASRERDDGLVRKMGEVPRQRSRAYKSNGVPSTHIRRSP